MRRKGTRVAILMSGGVDSSVAAALLKRQGFDVVGITLHLWDYQSAGYRPKDRRGCCDTSHQADARHVCSQIGIHHVVLDLRERFEKEVIHPFELSYLSGETPNPCVLCNSRIKWGSVLGRADELECDYIATGHYARIVRGRKGVRLERGIDTTKDQSYALWQVPHKTLTRTILPLGKRTKRQIRGIAAELGLRNADKSESQEVCFIDEYYGDYLRETHSEEVESIGAGEIIDQAGKVLGTHEGFYHFTVGQRRGLNIRDGQGPYYVIELQPETNTVVAGNLKALECNGCLVRDVNWVSYDVPDEPAECKVKIRYNDPGAPAVVFPENNGTVTVRFRKPRTAVTPGQSAVWYRGRAVWGGGIITKGIRQ